MCRLLALAVGLLGASLTLAQAMPPGSPVQQAPAAQPAPPVQPPDPSMSVEQLEARGDELRVQRFYGDAIDYYLEALTKRPKEAMLWNKIGLAELRLSRYEEAKKHFEKAVKIDRNFPDAVGNLGATHYLLKEYSKAIKLCRKAIKMRTDVASFHNNLANAYFSRKEYDNAVREFARALELDPEILERRSSTGIQAQVIGAEDRARYDYELARVYARAGSLDRALHYLKKAMEDGYSGLDSVYKEQEFADLRKDPRFAELMNSRPQAIPQ
ncbi:MAG TPA: tetratricopeptide repeat protein [Terriglobales bacterium]|nr:tetratricopeptide repeat protein [Terriglobales bacterium]